MSSVRRRAARRGWRSRGRSEGPPTTNNPDARDQRRGRAARPSGGRAFAPTKSRRAEDKDEACSEIVSRGLECEGIRPGRRASPCEGRRTADLGGTSSTFAPSLPPLAAEARHGMRQDEPWSRLEGARSPWHDRGERRTKPRPAAGRKAEASSAGGPTRRTRLPLQRTLRVRPEDPPLPPL
ncbi:hypothetical protein NDU88_005846 [Pleurodeles waltl]|uniref:Uncharacterized protein n=1 Tax=Pleurodeles waltl TaxID=8319 RepID=A0AAV7N707_PLEWA|nr:hypothetical protein NDU88_005846 [Pleurodeles waltl]